MEELSLITLKDISKVYGEERTQIKALDHIDLEIEEGKIITVMGPSGSGKSTLLNILGAMDKPSSGKVLVNEIDIGKLAERKLANYRKNQIGFVFQSFYLIPNLDVVGNVLLPKVPYGIKDQDRKRAQELLDIVGLGDRRQSKVGKLSGGESQRVAIARALINDPKVILADEPTGNLDSETGAHIMELLTRLNKNLGTTIIVVTHDENMALFAEKKMVIQDGSITNLYVKKLKTSS